MRAYREFVVAGTLVTGLCSGTAAYASPITTVFDTGVDSAHAVLANGTVGDPHYSLFSVPSGPTSILVRSSSGGFPIPPYNADDALSRWIGPDGDTSLDGPNGQYDYRTTFDLTGFNFASAILNGGWATDNEGINILINGVATGNTISDNTAGAFSSFHAWSISTGFIAGVNTLDFIVNNDSGPTALRVEMTGTAAVTSVPEPATLALFGAGLAGLGALRRRRKAKA